MISTTLLLAFTFGFDPNDKDDKKSKKVINLILNNPSIVTRYTSAKNENRSIFINALF